MEALTGLLFIGLLIGGVMLWQKATGAASNKLNQKVLDRKGHDRGRKIVSTRLTFTTSRLTAEELLPKIVGYAALPSEAPRVVGAAYIEGKNATQLVIAMGNKLSRSAQLLLHTQNRDDGAGCSGSFQVAKWTEADGVVAGYQEMERLFGLIREAILHADPEAAVNEAVVTKAS